MAESRLDADPIFAALTRPQMLLGVTYDYAIVNLIITTEIFLITKAFSAILVALFVHAIGYVACIREPRIFALWFTKARSCPRIRNYRYWRCNSYHP
jgi:type IV secretion system protein VirB3